MTGQPDKPPDDHPPEGPPALGYSSARAATRGAAARLGQVVAGAVMAATIVIGVSFGLSFAIGKNGFLLGPLVAVALLVLLAMRLRRNPLYRPWAAGIGIGAGVGLLADGLCWAFMTGMEH
jgi:hypothetical protein